MRTRESLSDRVTATIERPITAAADAVSELAQKGSGAIADLAQTGKSEVLGRSEEVGGRWRRRVRTSARSRRKVAKKQAEAARRLAVRSAAEARKAALQEGRRRRKRFFRRRRQVQALAAERVDAIKASAAAAGSAAAAATASRASDAASAGADQARTLAGEARSWLAEQAAGIDVGGALTALAPTALSKPVRKRRRPLTTVAIGAAAGLVGMAAMDAAQRGLAKASPAPAGAGGGEDRDPWQDAPSPAKVGRRIWEGVLRQGPLGPDKIEFATNVVHVGYGITLGAVFALVEESRDDPSPLVDGAIFGLLAWAFEEYLLPRVDVSPPAKTLSAGEHAQDLAFHLAYGLGVGATIAAADARR